MSIVDDVDMGRSPAGYSLRPYTIMLGGNDALTASYSGQLACMLCARGGGRVCHEEHDMSLHESSEELVRKWLGKFC